MASGHGRRRRRDNADSIVVADLEDDSSHQRSSHRLHSLTRRTLPPFACVLAITNASLLLFNHATRNSFGIEAPRRLLIGWVCGFSLLSRTVCKSAESAAVIALLAQLQKVAERTGTVSKTFRVQRSGIAPTMATEAFSLLGLRAANASVWQFDIWWGAQWTAHEDFLDSRLPRSPQTLVNSLLGFAEALGGAGSSSSSEGVGQAAQLCEAQYGQAACSHVLPTFTMPSQLLAWREAQRVDAFWIRKEQRTGGPKVHVASSTSKLVLPDATAHQLQQYMTSPLLWHGRKHDLRLWALITSVQPLRLYLLQDAWARIASRTYDRTNIETNLADRCMHITSVNCEPLPTESVQVLRTSTRSYKRGLNTTMDFARQIWPAIEKAVANTVRYRVPRSNEPCGSSGPLEAALHYPVRLFVSRPYCCFQVLFAAPLLAAFEALLREEGATYRRVALLSVDVLVSADGIPRVADIDASPCLISSQMPHSEQYARDAMALLGVRGYPRRPAYAQALAEHVVELCFPQADAGDRHNGRGTGAVRCGDEELEAMQRLVDETEHAGAFAR